MRYATVTERLSGLGGDKWELHALARQRRASGREVIELTIGEPDVATPAVLIDAAAAAMRAGRTGYSNGRGEPALLAALAARYTRSTGRAVGVEQFLCLPGTQTALYAALSGIVETGDEVLVGDPMYATYEGVIAATGARLVPVPLRAERGFQLAAADLAACLTPNTRAVLLNTPHNPSGAVLSARAVTEIGALAREHDLWLVCDEVYEELVFDGVTFASPLARPELAERTVVVSSISKSHAAPGFRSGWCVGPAEFAERLLPLVETLLFGNQPFIADMTAVAIAGPSPVAAGMRALFARRADVLCAALHDVHGLRVCRPQAGMFALLDISATGLSSRDYALGLLDAHGVAVMPGSSFGVALDGWVRIALTADDAAIVRACAAIVEHAASFGETAV